MVSRVLLWQNIILITTLVFNVDISNGQGEEFIDTITSAVEDLVGGGDEENGGSDAGTGLDFSAITSGCGASTRTDMNRFGIEHNVALDATGVVLGEDLPSDMDGYVLIVKDQAKSICDGEQLCLDGLDTFTIEAMNYVYRQGEEHFEDFTVTENVEVEKNNKRSGAGRRLSDVLPKNDLSDRVLEVLEIVMDNIALDTEGDIIRALESLEAEVDAADNHPDQALNEDERYLVNAAISVAKASTTYWQKAYREESNHYRRLQKGQLLNCAIAGQPGIQQDHDDDHDRRRNLRSNPNKKKNKLGKKPRRERRTKAKKKKYHPTNYYWDDFYYDDYYYDDYYNNGWFDPCGQCASYHACETCYSRNGYGAGSYTNGQGGYFNGAKYNHGGPVNGGGPGYHSGNFVNGGRQGYNHGGQVGRGGSYYNGGRPQNSRGGYYGSGNKGRPNPYYGYGYGYGYYQGSSHKGNGSGGYYGLNGWMEFNDDYYMQLVPGKSDSKSKDESNDSQITTFFDGLAGFGLNTFYVVRADVVGVVVGAIAGRGCLLPAAASAFLFSALYAVCYRDPDIGLQGFFGN